MKIKDFINADNWTQGAFARDSSGEKVDTSDPTACRWCFVGMVFKFYPDHYDENNHNENLHKRVVIWKATRDKLGVSSEAQWNDSVERTWEDVKKLCEELDI